MKHCTLVMHQKRVPNLTVYSSPPPPNEKLPLSTQTSLQFDGLPPPPENERLPFSVSTSDLQFSIPLPLHEKLPFSVRTYRLTSLPLS